MGKTSATDFSANGAPTTKIPLIPLRTAMWDGPGANDLGALTRTWIVFFEQLAGALGGAGGLLEKIPQPIHEVPQGNIDGINQVFTLSYAPLASWLVLHLDNALEDPVSDYTLSGRTITYTIAPQIGDNHHAWYLVGSTASARRPITQPVVVVSTPGVGKVLWCDTAADIPPSWQTVALSDAAWAKPVLVSSAFTPAPNSQWISDSAGARSGQPHWDLYRIHFTIPGGTFSSCTLTISADDWPDEVWINGVEVYAPAYPGGIAMTPPVVISLPTDALVTGDNLLAIMVRDAIPFATAVSFNLTIAP
jgi:hypothetical protein